MIVVTLLAAIVALATGRNETAAILLVASGVWAPHED